MKTLYLVRHAKSSWANVNQQDFDRPLNDRGLRDAPRIGAYLDSRGVRPGLILASSARRTSQTANLIAAALHYPLEKIRFERSLYHADPDTLMRAVAGTDEAIRELMVVAHNPGITDLANMLTEDFSIDNLPTCGVVAVRADAMWADIWKAERSLVFYQFPKNLKDSI